MNIFDIVLTVDLSGLRMDFRIVSWDQLGFLSLKLRLFFQSFSFKVSPLLKLFNVALAKLFLQVLNLHLQVSILWYQRILVRLVLLSLSLDLKTCLLDVLLEVGSLLLWVFCNSHVVLCILLQVSQHLPHVILPRFWIPPSSDWGKQR